MLPYLFIYLFDSDHKGPYANTHKIHTRSTVKIKLNLKNIKIMIIIIKAANITSNHTHGETANTQTSNTQKLKTQQIVAGQPKV